MIDPGHVAHPFDMGHDVGDGGPGHRVRGLEVSPDLAALGGVRHPFGEQGHLGLVARLGVVDGAADEAGHKGDHHDAAIPRQARQDRVGDVPDMVGERTRGAVGEDHRRRSDVQRVAHRPGGHMREIHQHSEPVHLPHDLLTEAGQPAVGRRVRGGIGPRERHVVGEGQIPGAELVVHPEGAEGVLDGVAPLHPEERADLVPTPRPLDPVRGGDELEIIRIRRDHPPGDVELLQLYAGEARVLDVTGEIDRPELPAEMPGAHPGDVGHPAHAAADVVGRDVAGMGRVGSDLPGKIVVAVDERGPGEELVGVPEGGVGGLRGKAATRQDGEGEQECGHAWCHGRS